MTKATQKMESAKTLVTLVESLVFKLNPDPSYQEVQ